MMRANIVDGKNIRVGDVLRSTRSSRTDAPQRDQFLTALADANIPETVIKNNAALERYRAIKSGDSIVAESSRDDNDAISSTTSPTIQFHERAEDDEDYDDDDDEPPTWPTMKKKRADERRPVIEWTAPH